MDILVSELFDKVNKLVDKNEKINLLRKYDYPIVRALFTLNYNPSYKLDLPQGIPPFKRLTDTPIGYQQSILFNELKRFYIWMDPSLNINKIKKESLFIDMLEALHFTEADLICKVKDRLLTDLYPTLTESLVRESFPGIFPFEPTEVLVEKPKKTRRKL